jgi:CHAD domain-containing protein
MAYRFSHKDDSVQDGMRRITGQEIAAVVRLIDRPVANAEVTVHELRQTCKKLRAMLRLVRPVFCDFDTENTALRGIARNASVLRDATTLIGSFDQVVEAYSAQVDRQALGTVRRRLTLRRNALMADTDAAGILAGCRSDLRALEQRSRDWALAADGTEALQPGLRKAYRRARNAMRDARQAPTPTCMHAWRKRAKDHWYHARLFEPVWKGPMKAHAQAAHKLGDLLGDHHDLTVFLETLSSRPDDFGDTAKIEVLAGLATRRQAVLQEEAFAAGERLFAESPSALADAWVARYRCWRNEKSPHDAALQHALDAG